MHSPVPYRLHDGSSTSQQNYGNHLPGYRLQCHNPGSHNVHFHCNDNLKPHKHKSLSFVNIYILLCLKTFIVAPESRNPSIRDAWFFSSLNTRQPGQTRLGRFKAFVANPIPNTMASSVPTNRAVVFSSSTTNGCVPRIRISYSWTEFIFLVPSLRHIRCDSEQISVTAML